MSDNNEFNRNNDPLRVFIDSKNAFSADTGKYEFIFDLESYYDTFNIYFQLRKVQCTYSWYNISTSINYLIFNGEVISVEPGNYSIFELIDALNALGTGYTFTFNSITGKVVISNNLSFTWGYCPLAYLLGWTWDTVPGTTSNTTFTSPYLPDVSVVKTVNFHLTTVPSRSFASYPGKEFTRFMGSIFVGNNSPYSVIESSDDTVFGESTLQSRVRSFIIEVRDQRGELLDLQNGGFQMILEFTFRPKKVFRLTDFL